MYAIVKTGGKQYRVSPGGELLVERLVGEAESTVVLEDVLLVSNDEGLRVGAPTVEGATVVATILAHERGKKINGFTYKPKKHSSRRYGHRQELTRLRIDQIAG